MGNLSLNKAFAYLGRAAFEVRWALVAVGFIDFISLFLFVLSGNLLTYSYGDNRFYIQIAQTFYVGQPKLTVWFPLYPFFIRIFNYAVLDWHLSAHIVGRIFHILSAYVFFLIVRDKVRRPALLTFIFAMFPMEWPFAAEVGLSEPVSIFFMISSYYFFRRARYLTSFSLAALATLSHDTGILLFFVYLPFLMKERRYKEIPQLFLLPAAVAGLFGYYLVLFGDFFIYLKRYMVMYGSAEPLSNLFSALPYGSYGGLLYFFHNPVATLVTFSFMTLYIFAFAYLFFKRDWFNAWWIFVITSVTVSLNPLYIPLGLQSVYLRLLVKAFPILFLINRPVERLGPVTLWILLGVYLLFAFTYPFYKVPNSFIQPLVQSVLSWL